MDKKIQNGWVLVVSGVVIFFFTAIYSTATGEFNSSKFLPPIYVSVAVFWVGYFWIVDGKDLPGFKKEKLVLRAVWMLSLALLTLCIMSGVLLQHTTPYREVYSEAFSLYFLLLAIGTLIPARFALSKYEKRY